MRLSGSVTLTLRCGAWRGARGRSAAASVASARGKRPVGAGRGPPIERPAAMAPACLSSGRTRLASRAGQRGVMFDLRASQSRSRGSLCLRPGSRRPSWAASRAAAACSHAAAAQPPPRPRSCQRGLQARRPPAPTGELAGDASRPGPPGGLPGGRGRPPSSAVAAKNPAISARIQAASRLRSFAAWPASWCHLARPPTDRPALRPRTTANPTRTSPQAPAPDR